MPFEPLHASILSNNHYPSSRAATSPSTPTSSTPDPKLIWGFGLGWLWTW